MSKNDINSSNDNNELFWISNETQLTQNLCDDCEDTYCKDNEPIKQEDGKNISKKQFETLVRNQTIQFINKGFDNIVVLVGAGASVIDNKFEKDEKGFAKSGVTVSQIAEEILNQLDNKTYQLRSPNKTTTENVDVFTLEEISKKSKYLDNIIKDKKNPSEKSKKLRDDFNLEELLSNVFLYEKFVSEKDKKKFINTRNAIMDIIIKSTSYDYDDNRFNHAKFLNILSRLKKREHKLNIVTTNYDTLLEDAAEKINWTVFDGFSFSQTPKFDSSMFDWNMVKTVPNVKTNEKIYKSNVANLLKIHGSITWTKSESGENILRKNKRSVESPVMIFPSSNKYEKSYQEPYFDLFHKFQELLHQPNTLLITTGFSFADNHIARMITSAIKTNDELSILITNYDIKNENSNENFIEIKREMKNFYNIAFLRATMNDNLTYYMGGTYDKD